MVQILVVEIANEPGRLFAVSDAIARAGVNVYLLTLGGDAKVGWARLLVDNIAVTRSILMGLDANARVESAVALDVRNDPGGLSSALAPIVDAAINVMYLSAFSTAGSNALAMVQFSDNRRAEQILVTNGHTVLDQPQLAASVGGRR